MTGPATSTATISGMPTPTFPPSVITVHAAPDLMMRKFDHGLSLANPSHRPQTFDLAKRLPGQSFHRIQGTPKQDPQTVNGNPVANTIILEDRDAIFLKR